jgi:hypothetical protein
MKALSAVVSACLAAGWCAGCWLPRVSGLHPVGTRAGLPVYTKTLTPTLRWESFPRPGDRRKLGADVASRVSNVTYELRFWPAPRNAAEAERQQWAPDTPVATGLRDPSYTPPAPLAPDRLYYWTVRARFDLDGRPRVTQWLQRAEGPPKRRVDASNAMMLATPRGGG